MGLLRVAALFATVVFVSIAAAASQRAGRVAIPGGVFVRGSNDGADDERPARTREIAPFTIDRTEVTRAQYARCVAARRCPKTPVNDADSSLSQSPHLPVTGVSWSDAAAYCAFAKGRLPTEDEWERAARGRDGRAYPWGDKADCTRANWGNFEGEGPCAGTNPGKPVAVGLYAAGQSPDGVLDLAGNVWEWTADSYDRDETRRVVKGGSCCSYFVDPRSANRNAWDPNHRDGDLGFRCVGL